MSDLEAAQNERESGGIVTVMLSVEDMIRVHELVVARAVALETMEEQAQMGCGSPEWRRPADSIRRAIYGR